MSVCAEVHVTGGSFNSEQEHVGLRISTVCIDNESLKIILLYI